MSEEKSQQPQLPPTGAIDNQYLHASESWFKYPVRVQPHHTDYAGVVWHGRYIAWMEEARVECLRSIGIEFVDLVALGCDLPVVEMSIRYHKSLQLGMAAVIKTRMEEVTGVRINWDYAIQSPNGEDLYVSAKVTLVAKDMEKGKIMRQLPPRVKEVFARLTASKN
ncbi:MAG: thioesterase family protein [Cyanobacteria bacterium J06632_19]